MDSTLIKGAVLIIGAALMLLWNAGCDSYVIVAGLLLLALSIPTVYLVTDLFRHRDSSFSIFTTIYRYITWRRQFIKGYILFRKLQSDTKNIRKLQDDELMNIVQYNTDTEYCQKWFKQCHKLETREDFRRLHPLVRYSHFENHYDRMIRKGHEKVLTSEKPVYYAETRGKRKRIPHMAYQAKINEDFRNIMAYVGRSVPGFGAVKKKMKLDYSIGHPVDQSSTGPTIGPVSASPLTAPCVDKLTTPIIGYDIHNEEAARYVHLLFGLRHRKLLKIEAEYMSLVYDAFVDMEKEWKNLVKDIRQGTLKSDLVISDGLRAKLKMELKPNWKRADELEKEFSKGFDSIAKRIWPNLTVIECTAGNQLPHGTDMQRYLCNEVKVYSPAYTGAEGLFGINVWPERSPANYLLYPYGIFYEFIPLADIHDAVPQTVFMDQLVKGQEYEVVITTRCGLYRYRLDDIVRVVEHLQQCPVIEFLYRSEPLLHIKAEKISEAAMEEAIEDAVSTLDVKVDRIVDFTACDSVTREAADLGEDAHKCSMPCYIVFLELTVTGKVNVKEIQLALADKVEENLVKSNSDYRHYRSQGVIGHLELYLTKPASFLRLRNHMLDKSTAMPAHLKMPRVLHETDLVRFMWGERVQTEASNVGI